MLHLNAHSPGKTVSRGSLTRSGGLLLCLLAPFLSLASTACNDSELDMRPRPERDKMNIAHRGASHYAPEHTRAAYLLAIEQGADFVEPDLQMTRDGVLVCLHDLTLERTTNVQEIFPDRYRKEERGGVRTRRWYVYEFTLEELKRLDAGSWFDPGFEGERILTLSEAIELVRGRAGLFPETKSPHVYAELGLDMEQALVDELRRHNLLEPGAEPSTPVILQSFNPDSLKRLRHELGVQLPLVQLVSPAQRETWLTREGMEKVREFAEGLGPHKSLVEESPEIVRTAHELGLTVTPYTFHAGDTGRFPDVAAEMHHFLYELEVDGVFTDNPDLFPWRD